VRTYLIDWIAGDPGLLLPVCGRVGAASGEVNQCPVAAAQAEGSFCAVRTGGCSATCTWLIEWEGVRGCTLV
jgi:hypothetical protein